MPAPAYPRTVGRYVIHEPFASGGMATIHLGRLVGPVGFSRIVAIKRLHEHLSSHLDFVQMFLDEARIAARIRHTNAVSTLDVVELENELFLVMDYVQGESLGNLLKWLRNHDLHLPTNLLCTIMSGVLHGLHAAHEATDEDGKPLGIIHRDVTPHNILIGADGVARIADFGIATASGRMHHTREGQIKGKIHYMSPEQLTSSSTDRRSDIYSTGVVLWEALTGQKLFAASTDAQVMYKVLEGKPDPPSQIEPSSPTVLDPIVLRALARPIGERFATAQEMALAIEQAIPPVPASALASWLREHAAPVMASSAKALQQIDQSEPGRAAARSLVSIPPPALSPASFPAASPAAAASPASPAASPTKAPSPSTGKAQVAPRPPPRGAPLATLPLGVSAAAVRANAPTQSSETPPKDASPGPDKLAASPPPETVPSSASSLLLPPTPDMMPEPPVEVAPVPLPFEELPEPGVAAPLVGPPIEAPRSPRAAPPPKREAAPVEAPPKADTPEERDASISFPELAAMPEPTADEDDPIVPFHPPSRHRRLVLGIVGASVLLLAGGGVVRALSSDSSSEAMASAASATARTATPDATAAPVVTATTTATADTAAAATATATATSAEPAATAPPVDPGATPAGSADKKPGVLKPGGTKKRNPLYRRD